MKDHYTFGDSTLAADRLALLAQLFERSSARFMTAIGASPGGRALDLGCGPGFTTELVHRVTRARETSGIDASELHVTRARERLGAPFAFAVHDATRAPYPVTDVDVVYARYLLGHLAAPKNLLVACAGAVRSGGLFGIEENCALTSSDSLFADYYERVAAVQGHYGQDAYVGQRLEALAVESGWNVVRYERTPIALEAKAMARLHAMNVRTWGNDAFAKRAFGDATIAAMAKAMEAVAAGERAAPTVTCVMGQIVLRLGAHPA